MLDEVYEPRRPSSMSLRYPLGTLVLVLTEPTEEVLLEPLHGGTAWPLENGSALQPSQVVS